MQETRKLTKLHGQYEPSFKRKIALEYLAGRFSYRAGAELYQLPSKNTVAYFVKWYKQNEYFDVSNPTANDQMKQNKISDKQQDLEEELRLAKLKIASLETIIDLAEEQFDIPIRKKSEAKQSK